MHRLWVVGHSHTARRSPDPPRPYLQRIHRRGMAVRLGLCTVVAVAFAVVPGIDTADRLLLVASVIGYGIAATAVDLIATPVHNNLASIVNAVLGISVLFLVTLFVPDALGLALLPYVIGVVFSAIAWGLPAGLATAGVASALTWISQALAPSSSRMEPVVLVTATVCFFGVALVADRLSAERRSQVQHFGRLYEALRGVSPQPDLSATLESIAGAVTTAVDAKATAILLSEGGHLVLTGPASNWGWDEEQIDEYTRRELEAGDDSPLVRAMRTGRSIIVEDIGNDPSFSGWAADWRSEIRGTSVESLVVVPLGPGPDSIGVMSVLFDRSGAGSDEERFLLEAYAEQAAMVIARAQAYQREKEAALRLEEADRLKSEFLGMVSHELRTPLTAVKGFVDTVLLHWDRLEEAQRRELLGRASANADELARLIEQLLDFTRVEANRAEVRPRLCSLAGVISAVATDLEPVLADHTLRVHVPKHLSVVADPDAIGQVLTNLLTNAVKYSESDTTVTITAERSGTDVKVSVADEGEGIPPDEIDQVFERFYQVGTSDRARRGTGIGLSIVRRFVELHGGEVWVDSILGVGSTFSFTLPAAVASGGDERELPREEAV
ncbi:MAG: ATP-binding protein [Acidimicrobiia bacterium]|nr:ATP-binding protein [Acidimicrobiia bacterium]